jgi:signal transduction histidine kinase
MSRRLLVVLALAGAGATAAAIALELFAQDYERNDATEQFTSVGIEAVWIVTGLIAWQRRPQNRIGPLMTALGFINIALHFSWDAALPFTLVELLFGLTIAISVHLFLAFPSGRLGSRFERSLVVFTYAAWLVLSFAWQLFWDPRASGECPECPRNLLLLDRNPAVFDALDVASAVVATGILLTTAVLLVRRVRRAEGPTRRALAPVLLAAAVALLPFTALLVLEAFGIAKAEGSVLWWIGSVAFALIPVAFLVGLLRTRMHRSRVAALVVALGAARQPGAVRDAIARALRDPSLALAFWLPDPGRYVDPDGRELAVSEEPGRAVTVLEHEGNRLAALVHDPALLDDPELVRAVGAAATLALENSRLQAELRAQLGEVRASRARIVEAGDAERRRLERDLHDGAQQRLLGIRLALQLARGDLAHGGASLDQLLAEADTEAVDALAELRALARGIHPAILTEEGLAAALAALGRRSPVPVALDVHPDRLPTPVEAAAYFVTAEALANIAKHAHATRATVEIARANGRLTVEIADDGIGGADPDAPGLRGLRDRVEALSGHLQVDSPPAGGTRVTAAIPCA